MAKISQETLRLSSLITTKVWRRGLVCDRAIDMWVGIIGKFFPGKLQFILTECSDNILFGLKIAVNGPLANTGFVSEFLYARLVVAFLGK